MCRRAVTPEAFGVELQGCLALGGCGYGLGFRVTGFICGLCKLQHVGGEIRLPMP